MTTLTDPRLGHSPRMTVEHLMSTYSKQELMRLFRFQMINDIKVLNQADVEMVLGLDENDPLINRSEEEGNK